MRLICESGYEKKSYMTWEAVDLGDKQGLLTILSRRLDANVRIRHTMYKFTKDNADFGRLTRVYRMLFCRGILMSFLSVFRPRPVLGNRVGQQVPERQPHLPLLQGTRL